MQEKRQKDIFLIWLKGKEKRIEEKEKNKDPQLGMHVLKKEIKKPQICAKNSQKATFFFLS